MGSSNNGDKSSAKVIETDLAAARRVLSTEADAITAMADSLDHSFSSAIDAILACSGRVIVSGLGKSGHIARKIAASLASTGTPAQHVHPSEASHGDLGMITSSDVVIMLSNSGENAELSDLIHHTRRVQIPLIGMSSRRESTLIKHSDIGLVLPPAPEACPMGMAPTTSSTMMLALGDAIAVSLMERRGFSKADYKELHPGGQLGKSLVRVGDIMHTLEDTPLVTGNVPVSDLISVLVSYRRGLVGILNDESELVGVFTDGDLGRNLDPGLFERHAHDVMTVSPKYIREDALAAEAMAMMQEKKIWAVFVVSHDQPQDKLPKPVGVLHVHDCLKAGFS